MLVLRPEVRRAMHYSHASGERTVQVAGTAGARAWRQEHGWAAQNQRGQCDWSKRTGRGKLEYVCIRLEGHSDHMGNQEKPGLCSGETRSQSREVT